MDVFTLFAKLEDTDKENEKINSFSETPGNSVKGEDLADAEDEIKENEDQDKEDDENYREEHNPDEEESTDDEFDSEDDIGDSSGINPDDTSDEDLAKMTWYQLQTTRFIRPEHLRMIDPNLAGIEDAADAAIIDNAVEPAEPTEKDNGQSWGDTGGGSGGGFDDTGEDTGGGDDFSGDFSFYTKLQPGTENLIYTTVSLVKGAFKALVFTTKYVQRAFRGIVHLGENTFLGATKLGKLWEFKLSKLMTAVDTKALEDKKIELFSYDDWMMLSKNVIELGHICMSDGTTPQATKEMAEAFTKIGVKLQLGKFKTDFHGAMDLRRSGTVTELGYTPDRVAGCFRYVQSLGEITDSKSVKKIKENLSATKKLIKTKVKALRKITDKESDEFKTNTEELNKLSSIYGGSAECVEAYFTLANRLIKDMMTVGAIYERAMIPEKIR